MVVPEETGHQPVFFSIEYTSVPKTGTKQEVMIIDELVLFLENLCLSKMGMEPQARQAQAREARRERAPDHKEVEPLDHDEGEHLDYDEGDQ